MMWFLRIDCALYAKLSKQKDDLPEATIASQSSLTSTTRYIVK